MNILILCTFKGFGGAETYTIAHYKSLLKKNFNVNLLVPKNSYLEMELKKRNLNFYVYKQINIFNFTFQPFLTRTIYKLVKKHNIKIVHVNGPKDIIYLKKLANKIDIKKIVTRHATAKIKTKYLKHFDGIVGVSKKISDDIEEQCLKNNLKTIKVSTIAPFFEEEKFLNFRTPAISKFNFFKNNFNLNLNEYPLLCMIANFNGSLENKNHKLIFQAIYKLIYEKFLFVNLILCGTGPKEKILKNIVKTLNIEKYVHFLGHTTNIAEILFYCDVKVLTSNNEAFSIALEEAAIMKKPIIASSNTGMENIVLNGKTGLLFKKNNLDDLVNKIETILKNKNLQKQLGKNAYNHVKNNFISDILIEKLDKFYKEINN